MMSTTSRITLATDGSWTLLSAYTDNILVAGPPSGWEVYVGTSAPSSGTSGMKVSSLDGAWSSSVLADTDSVYGRPFGSFSGVAVQLTVMKS